ncbi:MULTISPECIES: helix-turn-helix transcriptional regulator [unclassified Variovorax]|uniref:helix-turn-helix domain-containing protein n=1 Tax=unclassified Variovorax TaxID=663243 RepID=UPI000A044D1E|nr:MULTISPECIES: helix-turn-helix transcriptional regulator [unclassified Variovorax]
MATTKSFGFGSRLRAARQSRGMTGEELGRGAGEGGKDASKASVSDWENERHYPKADQLRVICMKLDISPDELLFGKNRLRETQLYHVRALYHSLPAEEQETFFSPEKVTYSKGPPPPELRPPPGRAMVSSHLWSSKKKSSKDGE